MTALVPSGTCDGHVPSKLNGSSLDQFDISSRLLVNRSTEVFSSYAVSLVDLSAGSLFAPIDCATSAPKAYSSVQTGPDSHIELNNDLVYCNHSCEPSLEFDVSRLQVRVARDRDLKKGDVLTFWYPSSEWEMAQPFDCNCGSQWCHGRISGAGQMEKDIVKQYWMNDHIEVLLSKTSMEGRKIT